MGYVSNSALITILVSRGATKGVGYHIIPRKTP